MRMVKRLAGILLMLCLMGATLPLGAQSSAVTLTVRPGFDGSFRENDWTPVAIQVSNDGAAIEGHLVVRPETSPDAVSSTFSTPVSLPAGARKSLFLYIGLSSFATEFRVDLMDSSGGLVTSTTAIVHALQPRDQLAVVFSQSASGTLDMTGVHDGAFVASQANWQVDDLPDRAAALTSVNRMVFSDIDSGALSSAQRAAIADWVAGGGHLIVTGGTSWQSTAVGLADLLPLLPSASVTVDSLTPLADWLRWGDDRLQGATVIATGTLSPVARVLVQDADGKPLLARRTVGAGTVDYLTMNPNATPLRGWGGLNDLWLALVTSVPPPPSWAYGLSSPSSAVDAVSILPGVDMLVDALPLCGFLALYIALIGPLNYLILNRINRREWAWVTIPLFIGLFSALAWFLGFNLRGNEVTIGRLTLVETWPDQERARVGQLVGMLSPRRALYSLQVSDSSLLRPLTQPYTGVSMFGSSVQDNTTIEQDGDFRAAEFPVDASFIVGFRAETTLPKPDISGQAALSYDVQTGLQEMRGSVRNDSQWTLNNPVILVRGQSVALEKALAPGDVLPFTATLSGEGLPSPSVMSYEDAILRSGFNRTFRSQGTQPTINDLLQNPLLDKNEQRYWSGDASYAEQETYRRYLYLQAIVDDPYRVVTRRGDFAYLAGWVDGSPLGVDLTGAASRTLDTLLVIAQIPVEVVQPSGDVLITADRFTWTVPSQTGLNEVGPIDFALQPGEEVVFRFTPLPDAVLNTVSELSVVLNRTRGFGLTLDFQLWNWEQRVWEDQRISDGNSVQIRQPGRYLGPQNAVLLRVTADTAGGYPRFDDLSIEQRGRF